MAPCSKDLQNETNYVVSVCTFSLVLREGGETKTKYSVTYVNYGNTGCGFFNREIQNKKGFWLKNQLYSNEVIKFCQFV